MVKPTPNEIRKGTVKEEEYFTHVHAVQCKV